MPMKRSLCILPVLLAVFAFPGVFVGAASAQVVSPDADPVTAPHQNIFAMGLFAGPASGVGLSFRHHLPSALSYQITGGIVKSDDRLSYSFGLELQFDIKRTTATRFYVAAGTSYFYSGKPEQNEMAGPGRLGAGIGGELHAGSGFHVMVDLLFTYFSDGTVLPLPQVGAHYYFR
jgi:hypothetical protein